MVETPEDTFLSSNESGRQLIHYSRQDLLSLYKSPLVPHKLDGMKDLVDWYGEYADPHASPPTRSRDLHSTPGRNSSSNSLASGRANPFTNFGRFGVDGGLEGGEMINTKLGGGDRRGGRDLAPHVAGIDGRTPGVRNGRTMINERGDKFSRANGDGLSPTKEHTGFFSNERERTERMKTRGEALANPGARERREEPGRKDRSRVDEGGWRSVGTADRERRLGRSGLMSTETREPRRERESMEPRGAGRTSRAPAWMEDEHSSSSSPAWMDAPATGTMSFTSDGHVLEKASRRAPPGLSSSTGPGGVDSIQAFKQQMKEMERKERKRRDGRSPDRDADVEPTSTADAEAQETVDAKAKNSASSALLQSLMDVGSPKTETAPQASVFETLGIRTGTVTGNAPGSSEHEAEVPRGGRGSRFAKFFDGKAPAAAQTLAQPQTSVFDSLLGGSSKSAAGSTSPGPSKEDAESMARLLGMLQVSSARAISPATAKKESEGTSALNKESAISPSPHASTMVPPPSDHKEEEPRKSSGGSRFASRFANSDKSIAPTSSNQSTPALQSPPILASPAMTSVFSSAMSPAQDGKDYSTPSHSRSASVQTSGAPSAIQTTGATPSSPLPQGTYPMSPQQANSGNERLIGPQSAASRPLPPLMNGPGGFLMSPGPHAPPVPGQMFSGPPPMELPSHLRGPQSGPGQQNGIPGMPPHFMPPPPFGRPQIPLGSMPPGSMPPGSVPPFMMYPPPPPGMFAGPPPPHFRGMPPPPPPANMTGIPFGPGGVPDLMALLNSGGGGAGARNGPSPRPQPDNQA